VSPLSCYTIFCWTESDRLTSKSTFSAASYAAFRPSYPASLYNTVLGFHRGAKKHCLDLGCGPGTVTRELSKHFDKAIGTDPSPGMIQKARDGSPASQYPGLEFREGSAETGSRFLEDGFLDMVVAGQAAHWFDQAKLWPEMKRLVRKGGTLAYWGYKDHVFVDFPKATEIMQDYAYNTDPELLGSYWPQPGRSYVQDKLRIIRPPEEDWEDEQRIEYEPGIKGAHSGEGTLFMETEINLGAVKEYVRTWSSYHGWQEKHPGQVARSKGGEGDIMDEMFDRIAREDEWFRNEENLVKIEWGSALIMARRK
jgi:SAM-dependent methyltransferase